MSERTESEESGDDGGESSGTTEASTEEAPPAGEGGGAVVTSITENDVLLGRGAPAIYNTGNVRFRAMAQKRRDSYNNAPRRSEKDKIARELMQEVAKRGGRFLRKIESSEQGGDASIGEGLKAWKVADETVIADKIKQTLRCKELSPADPATKAGVGPKRGRDSDSFAGLGLSEQLGPEGMAILRGQMPMHSGEYPAQATDDEFTLLLKRQEEERLALLQRQQEEQRAHLLAVRAKNHHSTSRGKLESNAAAAELGPIYRLRHGTHSHTKQCSGSCAKHSLAWFSAFSSTTTGKSTTGHSVDR